MNIFVIFNIINIPIALFLGITVYSKEPAGKLNKIFLTFMLIAAYTAFCEFFRLGSPDERYAMLWHRASFLWPFFVFILLKFVMEISGSKAGKNRAFNFLMFLPAFAISALHLFTNILYTKMVREPYGWVFIHAQNFTSLLVVIYFLACGISSFFIITKHYFFIKNKKVQRKILFVIIGIAIPTFVGLVINGLLQDLGVLLPPLDSFVFIISAIFISFGVRGKKSFIVDPLATVKELFTSMKEYLLIINSEKEIVFASDSYLKCTGYIFRDIDNKKIQNFIKSGIAVKDLLKEEKLGKEIEIELITRDGNKIPVSMVASTIFDPNIKDRFCLLICRDLRERKRLENALLAEQKNLEMIVAKRTEELVKSNRVLSSEIEGRKTFEKALNESEIKYRSIFNYAPIGIFRAQIDGQILMVNNRLVSMLGYRSADELKAINMNEIYADPRVRTELIKNHSEEKDVESNQVKWKRKNGSFFWVQLTSHSVKNQSDRVIYFETFVVNIDHQKIVENELRESEERFRNLFNNSPVGIYRTNPQGKILLANPAIVKMLQFENLEELLLRNIQNEGFVKPKAREEFLKEIESKGEVIGYESTWRKKDGSPIIVKENAKCVFDVDRSIKYYEGTVEDITDQVRALRTLKESEEKFRVLAEKLPNAVVIYQDDTLKYVNDTGSSMIGYDKDYLTSKMFDFKCLFTPESLQKLMGSFEKHLKGEEVPVQDYSVVAKDGHVIDIYIRTKVIHYEQKEALLIIITDVTERKKMENAIRESEERYRNLIENINEVYFITNAKGRTIYISSNVFTFTGYKANYFIGKSPFILIYKNDFRRVYNFFNEKINDGTIDSSIEFRAVKKDGSIYWVEQITRFVRGENGKLVELHSVARDINVRKSAEEKLHLLAQAVKSSGEGISITDLNNNILFVNEAFVKMYGYSEEELIGKNISIIRTDNVPEPLIEDVRISTIKGGWSGEIMNKRKDGKIFPIFLSTSTVLDDNNVPYALVGVSRDISEAKKAEEKVQLLAQAVKSSGEAITVTNLKNDLLFVNQTFTEMYGYLEEEVLGKNISIIHSQRNPDYVLEEIRTTTINKRWAGELINQRKDGSEFPIFLSTSFVCDENGKPYALVGVARDITDRRKNEKQLEEYRNNLELLVEERTRNLDKVNALLKEEIEKQKKAEEIIQDQLEFLQTLIDTIPSPIFIRGTNKIYKGCNAAFAKFYNLKKEEIIGKSIHDLHQIISADYVIEKDRELLLSPGKQKYETITKDSSGVEYNMLVLKATFTKADGTIDGIVGILLDITEIKKLENEILNSLEKEKELGKMKTRFISVASHEFRTPLTSVLASADLLELYGRKWPESKYLQYVGNIQRAVEYMTELINDVLTVNREDSSRVKFVPEKTNLRELLDEIINNIKITASSNIKFKFDYKLKTNILNLDKKIIKQVITNLISNAVKYSPNGGLITVGVCKDENKLVINIEDEGIGISKEDLEHLAEPFHRGKNVGSIAGTGLGLSIAKRSIEIHNGIMTVESELNKGTKIGIRLNFDSI